MARLRLPAQHALRQTAVSEKVRAPGKPSAALLSRGGGGGRQEQTHPLCDSPARKLRPGSDHPETPTNPTEAGKSDPSALFQNVSVAKGRKDAPDVSNLDT